MPSVSDQDALRAVRSGKPALYLLLASNPDAPAFALEQLSAQAASWLEDGHPISHPLLRALCAREDLPPVAWSLLFSSLMGANSLSGRAYAFDPLVAEVMPKLLRNEHLSVDILYLETMNAYAENGSFLGPTSSAVLAASDKLSARLAYLLYSHDRSPQVDAALASNRLTPGSILEKLVHSDHASVSSAAVRNPYTPTRALHSLPLYSIPKDVLIERAHSYGTDAIQFILNLNEETSFETALKLASASKAVQQRDFKHLARQAFTLLGRKTHRDRFLAQARQRLEMATETIRSAIPRLSVNDSSFTDSAYEMLRLTSNQADLYEGLLSQPHTPEKTLAAAQEKLRRYVLALEEVAKDMKGLIDNPWPTYGESPFERVQARARAFKDVSEL